MAKYEKATGKKKAKGTATYGDNKDLKLNI